MVIDSSALLAILQKEPEAATFAAMIRDAPERYASAVSILETGMVVVTRRGPAGSRDLDDLISNADIEVVPFDARQAVIARSAHERYGRGRHPARLNFGDCAAYALATSLEQPLLFKGGDFARTDISPVA